VFRFHLSREARLRACGQCQGNERRKFVPQVRVTRKGLVRRRSALDLRENRLELD
jgi:hypothetical protein